MKHNKNTRVNAQAYIEMLAKDSEERLFDDDLVKTIDEIIITKIENGEVTDESLIEAIIDYRLSKTDSLSNREIRKNKRLIWKSVDNAIRPVRTQTFKRASVIVAALILISVLSLSVAGAIDWSVFTRIFEPDKWASIVNKNSDEDILIDKIEPIQLTNWDMVPKQINGCPAVLNWTPEQYKFVLAIEITRSTTSSLSTRYSNGIDELSLSVRNVSSDTIFYGVSEKNSKNGEILILGGMECTLTKNFENINVTWQLGNADYLLVSKCEMEEIEKMIISINGG